MAEPKLSVPEALAIQLAGLRVPPSLAELMGKAIVESLEVVDSEGLAAMGSESITFVAESRAG